MSNTLSVSHVSFFISVSLLPVYYRCLCGSVLIMVVASHQVGGQAPAKLQVLHVLVNCWLWLMIVNCWHRYLSKKTYVRLSVLRLHRKALVMLIYVCMNINWREDEKEERKRSKIQNHLYSF